jgi:CrcB protein
MGLRHVLTHPAVMVGLGGAVGSVARYYVVQLIGAPTTPRGVPWGTFAVNVSGSFLIGLLALVIVERLSPEYRPLFLLLGTGVCGGYTTFSALEWELYKLIQHGAWGAALIYVGGSLLCGFLGVVAAALVVRLATGRF